MSTDMQTLNLAVDSSELVKATSDLDRFVNSGTKAESTANDIGDSFDKTTQAATRQRDALDKLLGKIDPVTKKLNELAKQEKELAEFKASGAISGEAYTSYQKKVEAALDSLLGLNSAQKAAVETHEQAAARLLQVARAATEAKQAQLDMSNAVIENAKNANTNSAAVSKMANEIDKVSAKSTGLVAANDKTAASSKKVAAAFDQQDKEILNLLGSIDPIGKKLNDLDNQQEKLFQHMKSGRISPEVWADYKEKIDVTRANLGRFDDSLTRTGNTAKQTAAAMRGVPAQFTDIFVSLQGGQAPMTVFLQQGGQLKDMFGGIGPAARAMGTYIAGLVNPFTVAAAAAAVLALAYHQGSAEQDAFRTALITTGNVAGTTTGQMASMAKSVSATVGTSGAAAEALALLASTGKITSDSFEQIATSALLFEKATGKAASETIAEFVKIADAPVKAIGELDDKYHFLTASVYEQIRALEEQGNKQEAAIIAENAYSDAMNSRSEKLVQNLGYIQKAWNGVAGAAKWAWDKVLDIGREKTLEEKLADLNEALANAQRLGTGSRGGGNRTAKVIDKEITDLLVSDAESKNRAAAQGRAADALTKARKDYDDVKDAIKDLRSNEDKRADALLENERKIANAREKGFKITAEEEAKLKQGVLDKFKDKATPKGAATPIDYTVFNNAENELKAITSQVDNSLKELDALQKNGLISQEEYSLKKVAILTKEKDDTNAAYLAEIAALEEIKGRRTTNANERVQLDQKIADARANMAKASEQAETKLKVTAADEAGRLKKQTEAVNTYKDALDAQLEALQQQGARNAASVGMGASQKAIFDQISGLTDKLNSQRLQLANQYGDGSRGMSLDEYNLKLKALSDNHDAMTRQVILNYRELQAAQSDWTLGAKSAFQNYIDSAADIAGQTRDAFTNAFAGIEDVFTKFITTGKLSFKDFADSVIADLARIVVKQQIIAPMLQSAFGSQAVGSDISGGTGGGSAFGNILSMGQKAYSIYNSGLGQAISSGWSSGEGFVGGVQNAWSSGTGYLSGALGMGTGAAGAAASTGLAQGATAFGSQFGTGIGAASFPGAAASAAGGASTGAGAAAGGLSGAANVGYGIGGAIMGYQQAGLKGAATGALGAVGGAQAGAALGTAVLPGIGTAIGAALGAILGGTIGSSIWGGDWQTKDQGLQLGVSGGDFTGNQYEYQKKKGGLFSSNKKRTRLISLDPEMQKSLDAAYNATEASVYDLFDKLNVDLNAGVLDGLNVASTQISTKGKTAEQIQEEVTKWFSGISDAMVGAIDSATGAGVGGMNFEQLTTFVNNLYSVNDVLKNLNIGVFEFNVKGGFMAEQLSALAGGLENLTKNASAYYDGFFTDTEKANDLLKAVNLQFAAMGLSLPTTRQGFRDTVEAIDITTEAGRTMFVTLTNLAGGAAQAYTILEQRAADAAKAISDSLMLGLEDANSGLKRSVEAERTKTTDAYNALVASLNDISATASKTVSALGSMGNALKSALDQIISTSDTATSVVRSKAKATLQDALNQGRAGKTLEGFVGLEDALKTLSNNDTSGYASLEAYMRDQGQTVNQIDELNKINGRQLSNAEKTVETLKASLEQAKLDYDAKIKMFDAQLAFAQLQLDAINGVDNSVKSLSEAIKAMNSAVIAALAASKANPTTASPQSNGAIVETIYNEVLGRNADAGGKDYWIGQLASGSLTYQNIAQAIANAALTNSAETAASKANAGKYLGVPGYADGTGATTANGWMTVGETGPELMKTGPVSIKSNAQSKAFMKESDAVLAAKVDKLIALTEKQIEYSWTTAKSTTISASRLEEINDREMANQ